MRGIASRLVVSSLLSGKSKLGELSEMTLFSLALVWILASWDCRRLHTSNTPISLAIRMTPTTSTLTGTYRSHPRPSTLIVTRKADRMFLLYGNQLGNRIVKNLTAWAARKRSVNRWSWHHDGNVGRALWRGLFGNTWLGVCFKIQGMVRRLVSVLEFGLGPVNLERTASEISFIKKFQSQPPGK